MEPWGPVSRPLATRRTAEGQRVDHDAEPTLQDGIALIRRGLVAAVVVATVVAMVTYVLTSALPPRYEASATLLVSAQDPNQRYYGVTLVTAPPLDPATYVAAIRSREVLADALRDAGGSDPSPFHVDDVAATVTVRAQDARISSNIMVFVRREAPGEARDLANAIAAAAVRWDRERATRTLETIIVSLEGQIASLDEEIRTAGFDAPIDGLMQNRAELQLQLSSARRALPTAAVGRLEVLESATTPRARIAPRPARSAAIAAVFAVLLTYGLLLLRRALDNRVRDPQDLARLTELPVLAEFEEVRGGRRGLPIEAASFLRTTLAHEMNYEHPKVVLVTSAGPKEGRSSVAIAVAESFARQTYKTLLIDADLRHPALGHEYGLRVTEHKALRDALVEGVDGVTVCSVPASAATLDLIPSFGPVPLPTELLANSMLALIERMQHRYDVIIIDSAPVLPVADALVIGPHVTGVVFVVSLADADRRQVPVALGLLRRMGVRVFGTVATKVRAGSRRSLADLGYGTGIGVAKAKGTGTAATKPSNWTVQEVAPLADRT